jgi:hypothetical protein
MADVYDDFDKRVEHDRRFDDTRLNGHSPNYSAPKKARPERKRRSSPSHLQVNLLDDLIEIGSLTNGHGGR